MEELAKLNFVTTRQEGVFALKLSKHLPMYREPISNPLDILQEPAFNTIQCGWIVNITKVDNPCEKQWHIEACKWGDENPNEKIDIIANEYDVLLVRKLQVSLIDEYTYMESYDLGNKAISRKEYELLEKRRSTL